MATMYIPTEQDVKQWVKEAMQESLAGLQKPVTEDEPLLSRKEVSRLLHVSLVTLNDWVKRGLPSHKQRGRVYFLKSEVMGYIREGGVAQHFAKLQGKPMASAWPVAPNLRPGLAEADKTGAGAARLPLQRQHGRQQNGGI